MKSDWRGMIRSEQVLIEVVSVKLLQNDKTNPVDAIMRVKNFLAEEKGFFSWKSNNGGVSFNR